MHYTKNSLLVKKASLDVQDIEDYLHFAKKDRYFFAVQRFFFTDGSIQDSVWKRSFLKKRISDAPKSTFTISRSSK